MPASVEFTSKRVSSYEESAPPLLAIRNLHVSVRTPNGWLPILDDINLDLQRDETLAIVGESGSGKSMLALAILRLLRPAPAFTTRGRISFEGQDLMELAGADLSKVRGVGISMIFQEALNALNPVTPVGRQIEEVLLQHRQMTRTAARRAAIELLRDVRLPAPEQRVDDYPHQLSGGMRQRVMIAIALAGEPKLVIADEPTTSLDVTIQSQILAILRDIRARRGMSMIFISHNLGAVAAIADRVAVMYAGQIVETGTVADIYARPRHPYTQALLSVTPRVDRARTLAAIPGTVPRFDSLPPGCRFAPRCPRRAEVCDEPQTLRVSDPATAVRCVRAFEPDTVGCA
jgi:oligopeptide/dipeptide ABC transporter ATP-binding protein